MAEGILRSTLDHRLKMVVRLLNRPTERYVADEKGEWIRENGRLTPNAGALYFDSNDTGLQLCEMASGGGDRQVSGHLRLTRYEMYYFLEGMLYVLELQEKRNDKVQ